MEGVKQRCWVSLCLLCLGSASVAPAATNDAAGSQVSGVIHVTKRLTKRRVPATAIYQRGPAVAPGDADGQDFVRAELARTVIHIESPKPLSSSPITVEINQKNRVFAPETVVVPVGSTVSFPNLDPIFHNVFSLSRPQAFDLGNYPRNETRTVTFRKPGIVPVYCHLHPDMRATIVVAPNSWATMPAQDGSYSFDGLPAGTYTIVVWHRSAGFFRRQVEVGSGGSKSVDFIIPVDPSELKR